MAYNIQALKADLEGVLHGTTINQIQGVDNLINRAARELLLTVDPQETKNIVEFASPIYSNVWDYPLPADFKGNAAIDIRPQVNRSYVDLWLQNFNQDFDLAKLNVPLNNFTIQYNNAVKTIRINAPFLQQGILLNDASVIVGEGTWSAGGDASNLQQDYVNFVSGGSSLSFDLAASGSSGYLVNSTSPAVNLTAHLNQSNLFTFVYLPAATNFTNVKLRWGSSATAYWESTATVTQQNTVFQNGWNLLSFPWASATQVGSPDVSNITYLRVTYTYNGTQQTSVRLNQIVSRLGSILELEYYSKYMFRDATTGAFQETVTDDSNLINLDTDSYNLLFYLCASLAVQQQQGLDAAFFDNSFFNQKYQEALQLYKGKYKSEKQKTQTQYYIMPNNNPGMDWRGRYG